MNKPAFDIVLASASPRRAQLLQQLGWQPQIQPVDIDESVHDSEPATEYCLRMAREKMAHAVKERHTSLPIITADTIVVLDEKILGKPKSRKEAVLTLIKLSAQEHHVYSAVSIWYAGKTQSVLSTNEVKMTEISKDQINAYVLTGEPMDKAGSYGIQGYAAMWIENIKGSYSSIMGLPLFETTTMLQDLGALSPLERL